MMSLYPTPRFVLNLALAAAAVTLCTAGSVHAQLTWDANGAGVGINNGNGAWLGTDLWWDGATNVNWTSGSDAMFGGAGTTGNAGNITLASPTTANSISFGNAPGGAWGIGTNGVNLTITNGVTHNGDRAATFNSEIILGGAQTWTNNSATLLSTANGRLIDNNGQQLTVDGPGNIQFGQQNASTQTFRGSGDLVKDGSGVLLIGGNNSNQALPADRFTGNITVNGGILFYGDFPGSMGTGNLHVTDGVIESRWSNGFTRAQGTGAGQIQITGGESGLALNGNTGVTFDIGAITWGSGTFNPDKFILQNARSQQNSNLTLHANSTINLNGADRTIVVGAGTTGNARAQISGAISNSTGTAGLIKEGDGRLILAAGASSWNGNTTISAGILDFTSINLNNIGGGSGRNISVADGAGVRFNALSNAILNRLVETTNEIGVMTATTSNNFDFSSSTGANLPNAFLGNWASNGAKAEISGNITPGSDGYKFGAKGSSGLLGIRDTLTGANDLTVGMTGATGIRVNLVAANTHTGETVINTNSKLTIGNNLALQNSPLNVGSAGGTFALASGTNGGRITGETEAASPTFGGLIGSRNLISVFTNAGGNNETNLAASAVTGFTLNVGTGNTYTYSGSIGGFGAGAVSSAGGDSTLTKTGLGTQVLSGANTYTGNTTINAGTLLINGSTSSASTVNVASGATLGGNGTVGGALDVFGTIAPGASIGLLTTGDQTWTDGTTYEWEVNQAGFAGVDYDSIDVAGALDFSTVTAGGITLELLPVTPLGPIGMNDTFALWTYDSLVGWDAAVGAPSSLFSILDTGGFNGNPRIYADNLDGPGTIWMTHLVPEPEAFALGLMGLVGVALLVWRRRS